LKLDREKIILLARNKYKIESYNKITTLICFLVLKVTKWYLEKYLQCKEIYEFF
jgi:hypothetical protein